MRWRGEREGSTSARGALGGRGCGSLVGAHSTGRCSRGENEARGRPAQGHLSDILDCKSQA